MNTDRRLDIFFDAFVIDGGRGWVFANNVNALFEIDLQTFEMVYLGSVPGEGIRGNYYWCMLKAENRLVLLPSLAASTVAVYDINSGLFTVVKKLSPEDSFFAGCVYQNRVFLIGNIVRKICVLDLITGELRYFKGTCDLEKRRALIDHNGVFTRNNHTQIGQFFYLALCDENSVARLDMENEEITFLAVDGVTNGLRTMCSGGDGIFWLNEYDAASVIKWSERDGVLDKYEYRDKKYENYRVGDMFYAAGRVWLFPTIGQDILTFMPDTAEWETPEELIPYGSGAAEHRHPWNQSFPAAILSGNAFYIFAGNTFETLKYSYRNHKVEWHRTGVISREVLRELFARENNGAIFHENNEFKINDFLWLL